MNDGMYKDLAERDAAIETIKTECRGLIAELSREYPGRIMAMPNWINGIWGDYWYIEFDGESAGDLFYDGFGPVPKGDKLCELIGRLPE